MQEAEQKWFTQLVGCAQIYHPSDGMCALRGVLQTALPTKAVGKRGNYLSPSEQKTLLPFSATSEQNQLCKTS